jgi:solute carrier family 25 phosphate transporter 3
MGKPSNKGKSLGTIASETGMVNLATKGLGARVVMIGKYCLGQNRTER